MDTITTREAAIRESHVKENDVIFRTICSSDNAANTGVGHQHTSNISSVSYYYLLASNIAIIERLKW